LRRLALTTASQVLDIGSGSGGPALFLARTVGCQVTGVDINPNSTSAANAWAQALGLDARVHFHRADASRLWWLQRSSERSRMTFVATTGDRGRPLPHQHKIGRLPDPSSAYRAPSVTKSPLAMSSSASRSGCGRAGRNLTASAAGLAQSPAWP